MLLGFGTIKKKGIHNQAKHFVLQAHNVCIESAIETVYSPTYCHAHYKGSIHTYIHVHTYMSTTSDNRREMGVIEVNTLSGRTG